MKNAIRTEEGQEADGKVKPKPRARLGDAEIVYLSDSEPEDEVYHDGEEEGEEGDWLKGYGDDTEDLQLQHLRLKTPTLLSLNLGRFKQLKRLCLRQNELISPLPPQALDGLEELEEIDLYDNRLGPVVEDEELKGCKNVTSLDLSFNNIRHPPTLPSMKQVNTLYLVQNKISHVEEGCLDWAAGSLKSLELGGNRIRAIENLDQLVLLEELWLGKNKIRILENLTTFTNLRILSLQSNRITKIQGLENLISLEELYLSHNGIKKIEGLEKNVKLTTLDIGNNMVEEIEGISHLVQLEEFWASNNQIQNLSALETQLSPLPNLTTVYLEGNPCQSNDVNYRRKVILALPQVQQVDATYVKVM
ncbi:hypothetical protein TREMEDRAFT_24836 [Tremella mesenterica DSM 1558]|uniref:uncharacterized protein n=1 Tax=Tremella mesenterica (strain ATCC 24925 / CBS 8224 / DSM 1558 / NBRC 9311 / NRRL Y-6157 / RJB 2259-6 / UBC 559-6) TaxID=578456 RepID=UPI0003F49208|nr:uncharacterized protein TREMEDRAFT_24836 [Tremella mesenterica DSM 1558]EIW73489.1 hypothetical protein TREMEDRAFT_24836 [Tremella mesenterica DSM 1558]